MNIHTHEMDTSNPVLVMRKVKYAEIKQLVHLIRNRSWI